MRRKIVKKMKKVEPAWINESIRREIKYRSLLNRRRRRRRASNEEERGRCWEDYQRQKKVVKQMVRDEKRKFEKKITDEVKREKTGRKMWKMIGKLKGDVAGHKRRKLYEENGVDVVDEDREKDVMLEFWRGIYQREENNIGEAWNEEEKREYMQRRGEETERLEINRAERTRREIPGIPRLRVVEGVEEWMEDVKFGEEDLKKRIEKIRNGKQPGLDGIKGEIYRALGRNEICLNGMVEAYNRVLEEGEVEEEWKMSKTIMLPKEKKPNAKQHRPID